MINPILEVTRSLDYDAADLPGDLAVRTTAMLRAAAERHCPLAGRQCRWGFKNPGHLFLLPLLERVFPRFRFVHVLRDGRDMVLSDNQNQPRMYSGSLFGRSGELTPEASAVFWATANLQASTYCARVLGPRRVRLEDLCAAPEHAYGLARALGLDEEQAAADIFPSTCLTGPVAVISRAPGRRDLRHRSCCVRLPLNPVSTRRL
jgi:sulfotransferase family protein